jgi:hypothetical protein
MRVNQRTENTNLKRYDTSVRLGGPSGVSDGRNTLHVATVIPQNVEQLANNVANIVTCPGFRD